VFTSVDDAVPFLCHAVLAWRVSTEEHAFPTHSAFPSLMVQLLTRKGTVWYGSTASPCRKTLQTSLLQVYSPT